MSFEALLPWLLNAFLLVVATVLYLRVEAKNKKILELQDERVEDARYYADMHRIREEPQVDKIDTPEEAGQKAVKDLERSQVMETLRRRAREEGRDVSEKVLEEDADRIMERMGLGPRSPNIGTGT